jgi:hypothetical protein
LLAGITPSNITGAISENTVPNKPVKNNTALAVLAADMVIYTEYAIKHTVPAINPSITRNMNQLIIVVNMSPPCGTCSGMYW